MSVIVMSMWLFVGSNPKGCDNHRERVNENERALNGLNDYRDLTLSRQLVIFNLSPRRYAARDEYWIREYRLLIVCYDHRRFKYIVICLNLFREEITMQRWSSSYIIPGYLISFHTW